jgi:hypothetical protein
MSMALATPGTNMVLVLPAPTDNSPALVPLGLSIDPASGKLVEGYAFIHYKRAYTHRPNHNPGGGGGTGSCFSFLSQGAKWKTAEPWVVNTANTENLSSAFVFSTMDAALAKWEDATDGDVTNGTGTDVFGTGATTTDTLVADTSSPDGINEIYFGDVSSAGAIAVTIVWGIFSGPPSGRELVEWDQIYDEVDFDWTQDGTAEPTKMDLDNIVTHEHGHAAGMAHPSDSCTEETMYRFAAAGEVKKRDLNTGDIAGINQLY